MLPDLLQIKATNHTYYITSPFLFGVYQSHHLPLVHAVVSLPVYRVRLSIVFGDGEVPMVHIVEALLCHHQSYRFRFDVMISADSFVDLQLLVPDLKMLHLLMCRLGSSGCYVYYYWSLFVHTIPGNLHFANCY
jgi:hypothetical protein